MRLEPGEQVMVRTRTHPRALLCPAAVLVAVAFLLGLAVGVLARPNLPGIVAANRAVLEAAAWVVAALVLLPSVWVLLGGPKTPRAPAAPAAGGSTTVKEARS